MAIRILDQLEQAFVGPGLADGLQLFNIINDVVFDESANVIRVSGKDVNGDAISREIGVVSNELEAVSLSGNVLSFTFSRGGPLTVDLSTLTDQTANVLQLDDNSVLTLEDGSALELGD